jgi:galactose-1-phosphate uridylyltransferase
LALKVMRVIYSNEHWASFMPFYSHWPFEIHIYRLSGGGG